MLFLNNRIQHSEKIPFTLRFISSFQLQSAQRIWGALVQCCCYDVHPPPIDESMNYMYSSVVVSTMQDLFLQYRMQQRNLKFINIIVLCTKVLRGVCSTIPLDQYIHKIPTHIYEHTRRGTINFIVPRYSHTPLIEILKKNSSVVPYMKQPLISSFQREASPPNWGWAVVSSKFRQHWS